MDTYEKKLALAKEALDSGSYDKETIEYIFPELAESEDERIRKSLKILLQHFCKGYRVPGLDFPVSYKDMLAWLEKQDEHKKFRDSIQVGDKVTRNQDGMLVNLSQLKRIAKPNETKQGEQNHTDKVEPKFKVGDLIKLSKEPKYPAREIISIKNDGYYFDSAVYLPFERQDDWKLVEQKPAWSEEDEQYLLVCKNALAKYQTTDKWDATIISRWLEDKLKTLKDRVQPQPKQEWSEENEKLINRVEGWLDTLCDYLKDSSPECIEDVKDIVEQLKSLRPQKHWKPSDEQIELLQAIVSNPNNASLEGCQMALKDIIKQLKKLREE